MTDTTRSTEDDVHYGHSDDYNSACGDVIGKLRLVTTRDADVTCPGCKENRKPKLQVGDDVIDPDGRRAQIADLTTIKIKGEEHQLAMVDYFDAPDESSANSSTPILVAELSPAEPLPRTEGAPIVVEANVEANPRTERYEIDRVLWESWPPARRIREVESIGAEEVNASGGWGASVIGE